MGCEFGPAGRCGGWVRPEEGGGLVPRGRGVSVLIGGCSLTWCDEAGVTV